MWMLDLTPTQMLNSRVLERQARYQAYLSSLFLKNGKLLDSCLNVGLSQGTIVSID